MKRAIVVLTLFIAAMLPFTVYAETENADVKGNISVSLIDKVTKEKISGEKILFYLVDSNYNTEINDEKINHYINSVKQNSTKEFSALSDTNGSAVLNNCKTGVYLIISDGRIFEPFCVTVPYKSSYNVEASPKAVANSVQTTTVPVSTSENSSDSQLPKTGMLQYPIPILAFSGAIIFAIGYIINEKVKKNEQ